MKNIDLIENFVKGYEYGKGSNLYIEDGCLVNYNTIIAKRIDGGILIDTNRYSQTTTKNQNALRRWAEYYNIKISETTNRIY